MAQPEKDEVLLEIRRMLRELFQQHQKGGATAARARAHGYLDGYMRGLLEAGVFSQQELLAVVREQRERSSGPGVGRLQPERGDAETANAA